MVDDSVNHGGELLAAEHGASLSELDIGCEHYAAAPVVHRYRLGRQSRVLDVEWHVADSSSMIGPQRAGFFTSDPYERETEARSRVSKKSCPLHLNEGR